ncbi:pyridoxal-phosphate dependent enzyme [Paraburkholderia sediminicola]|uniref:pyridoxal-phosphate dependent enzyme n=1 Tax=Paraburkholderia sediminicola TaxID=458836 RepID=UPI0038BBB9FD
MAGRLGWHVVADTSSDASRDAPRQVMQGYALIADEVCEQLPPGVLPTHVFVQGGVGGLAAALCSFFWERFGAAVPKLIVCEPEHANCLQLSARAGHPVAARGALDTIMAGLACREVSFLSGTAGRFHHRMDLLVSVGRRLRSEARQATRRVCRQACQYPARQLRHLCEYVP